jgi:hypothetical protein
MPKQEGGEPRMKAYLIELPVDLVTEGKKYALDHGMTFKAVVKTALEKLVAEKGGGKEKK